ncbi:hypothetical protein F4802DRAFT_127302 [Xylaria palmicola]|nr:hypothetical protein F4802DRAFT_127302 [Xylaria palmicola]
MPAYLILACMQHACMCMHESLPTMDVLQLGGKRGKKGRPRHGEVPKCKARRGNKEREMVNISFSSPCPGLPCHSHPHPSSILYPPPPQSARVGRQVGWLHLPTGVHTPRNAGKSKKKEKKTRGGN